mmetsp:Transcript_45129/g.54690  ORF Transcript_45129/g.54690 Transcript_45129/m.54690 type:complete len:97 (+) Transcript_45129:565-855(+)
MDDSLEYQSQQTIKTTTNKHANNDNTIINNTHTVNSTCQTDRSGPVIDEAQCLELTRWNLFPIQQQLNSKEKEIESLKRIISLKDDNIITIESEVL